MEELESTKSILLQGADDVEDQDAPEVAAAAGLPPTIAQSMGSSAAPGHSLISQIISPSPFQHHNDSATADRYRSALQRVTAAPTSDVEAWEAIMNECMSLYRTQLLQKMDEERNTYRMMVQNAPPGTLLKKSRSEDLEKKLDWVESCHGHLLKYFPYASSYYIATVEILLARSAMPFESLTGGEDDFSFGGMDWPTTDLQMTSAAKIDRIFELALGVKMDGSPANGSTSATETLSDGDNESESSTGNETIEGMCSSSVDLWLLYIRKRTRDAKRQALQFHSVNSEGANSMLIKLTLAGENLIRNWITTAYETALTHGAAFAQNNHKVWRQYLTYVGSWNTATTSSIPGQGHTGGIDHTLASKQKELMRSIYQRVITLPMLGLDALWSEYEVFEKAQSEQLAAALIAENLPKYQHARSIYLERNRVYSIHELQYGRLATPPVDSEFVDSDGIKKDGNEEEYKAKMQEECKLLAKWKRRCGYERANPERLSAVELTIRVRQCYKDAICCFMRHIEVWHEWSMWELLNTGGNGLASNVGKNIKRRHVNFAVAVLDLAQTHIPDSTLLAYTHAQVMENQAPDPKIAGAASPGEDAIEVMEKFCDRSGNTLGYTLLQRLVRKYKGVKEARAVFSEARRKLRIRPEDTLVDGNGGTAVTSDLQGDVGGQNKDETAGAITVDSSASNASLGRNMVMNRSAITDNQAETAAMLRDGPKSDKKMGYLTWHLYASHALIEHRLNASPIIAARVYELGLKKHRSFLSIPQYVMEYSKLLMELSDEENLRALLTRAIAACEEENDNEGDEIAGKMAAARKEAQKPLWDMMLKFESTLSARSGDVSIVQSIEARRRKALYGPTSEDVSGGNACLGNQGDAGIGVQKASLTDTLVRTDGYDISSRIVNGLDRLVDSLEVSGILGQDSSTAAFSSLASLTPGSIWKDDGAGGLSDASFRRRKQFLAEIRSFDGISIGTSSLGGSKAAGMANVSSTSGRLLSAKERLAQSAAQSQNMTVRAAVEASPEWLRGMLMLLPATLRNYRGAKAAPHMIEMALSALKQNNLPAVRPPGKNGAVTSINGGAVKRPRGDMNGGNSSDEDDGVGEGGYGSQFRARQRARLLGASSTS